MSGDRPEIPLPPEASGASPGRGRLAGRRILVVGAGQNDYGLDDAPIGNGRAISALCAREGAVVFGSDVSSDNLAGTVTLVADEGADLATATSDVADPGAVESLVADATAALGGLDGVVYNIGIGAGRGLADTDADTWDRVFAVNLRGAMLVARAALPVIDDGSSIVFISSVAGIKPGTRIPAYDSSKAGLVGLMRHVAVEGERRGIRANVVAPGLMDTSLGRVASAGRPSRTKAPIPLGRQGTAWETAYAALFLLSNESSYITGQSLVVDGGLTSLR